MTTRVQRTGAGNNPRGKMKLMSAAQEAFRELVEAEVGADADFETRERVGLELSNELCRVDQERWLRLLAVRYSTADVLIDGKRYRRHSEKTPTITYHGLCGPLRVERALYRATGTRNGTTVAPLEVVAGLMRRATPALLYAVTRGYARSPSRLVSADLVASHRCPPSRSTTERIAKGVAADMAEKLEGIESAIRATEALPEGTVAVSLGLDRTTVPMEEPAGPDKPPVVRETPYVRATPAPVEVNYRMAYVGTFSALDADGRSLVTRRYGIAGDVDTEEMMRSLRADVTRALQQRSNLPVVVVQDGAPEMWKLTRSALGDVEGLDKWHEAIDRHHLLERLADVLRCADLTPAWRAEQLRKWNDALDADDGTIDLIEEYVLALRKGMSGPGRAKLNDHLTYLENNKDRMRYATLREARLPVGSGATEGACKALVMVRAKACGQRWRDDGIDAVLVLRGLLLSDRLPAAVALLRVEHSASLKLAA